MNLFTSRDRIVSRVLLFVCIAVIGTTLVACGGSGGSGGDLWEEAQSVNDGPHHGVLDDPAVDDQTKQGIQNTLANALDRALQQHPDGPEGLRQLLTDMRDEKRRLGSGDVRGSAADEMLDKHEQWWAAIEKRELPADYQ